MKKDILVVDDSRAERFYFSRILTEAGADVETAAGGKEAISKSKRKKYEIIFLDKVMPEPDGFKVLDRMRGHAENPNADTRIIMLTSDDEEVPYDDIELLRKPVEKAILLEALHKSPIPDWLRNKVPEIDVDKGVANCGSEEGFIEVLNIFQDTLTHKANEIQDFYDKRDLENYTIKVHALKSSLRIIGAEELSSKAEDLEMAGKAGDWATIDSDTGSLLSEYRSVGERLQAGEDDGKKKEEENKPLAPPEVLADAYGSIAEFSRQMDFNLVEMVIKSLSGYSLPQEDQNKINNISDKLLSLDWDAISAILDE